MMIFFNFLMFISLSSQQIAIIDPIILPFCYCTKIYRPACSKSGKTFSNKCLLDCEGEVFDYDGRCSPTKSCSCTTDYNPVCGEDGTTYINKCRLYCKNVSLKHEGKCCSCENVSRSPVCGSDKKTYDNDCLRKCAGVEKLSGGDCEVSGALFYEGPLIKKQKSSETSNVEPEIEFSISSKYTKIQRLPGKQEIPVLVKLKTKNLEVNNREGIDLIIVVDVSGSMQGNKIDLVKDTLLFVVDQLQEYDRLSLISFNDGIQFQSKLNPMTSKNKATYKGIVGELKAGGNTNLKIPLETALNQLLNRQEINEISSIFFLSDGQDTTGNRLESIKSAMTSIDNSLKEKNMSYSINSFGYGADHDENVLSSISDFKNGDFYYIKNNNLVDQTFLDSLGKLMSVVAKKAKITIIASPQTDITDVSGSSWMDSTNTKQKEINVGLITSGFDKSYLAIAEVKTDDQSQLNVVTGHLIYETQSGSHSKEASLTLQ